MKLVVAVLAFGLGMANIARADTPISLPHEIEATIQGTLKELNALSCKNPGSCSIAIGQGALRNMLAANADLAVGVCAGANITDGSRNILIGNFTTTFTPHDNGLVNIGNKLCFWRDVNPVVLIECPKPLTGCHGGVQ